MGRKVTLFVVSDVHGHATLLKQALDAAGYDPHNRRHLLVDCGDNFDRGPENRAMHLFLKKLPRRRVLLCGNHEEMLAAYLSGMPDDGRFSLNEIPATAKELLGEPHTFGYRLRSRRLVRYLGQMRNYFETKHYVFVHGWLPITVNEDGTRAVAADWRRTAPEGWAEARWTPWLDAWDKGLFLEDKTVVCGHCTCAVGNRRFHDDPSDTPFEDVGILAVDAATAVSGRVNVVVLEDELL